VAPDETGAPKWRFTHGADTIPYLAYSEESGLGRIVKAQHFEQRAVRLQTVFSAQLAATLMSMARQGRGVAWLPASLAEHDVVQRSLVRAGDSDWEIDLDIRVFRPCAPQSPAAEAFWTQIIA
jgi:DNA-binding transcriptional LysR family regulator